MNRQNLTFDHQSNLHCQMCHFRPNGNEAEKMHMALSMAHHVSLDDDPIQLTPLLEMEIEQQFSIK